MNLSFVVDLNESSQYRTRQILQSKDAEQLSTHIFVDLIVLWILYNEYDYMDIASEYAKKSVQYGNFDLYRQSSNDLYLAIYGLMQQNKKLNKPMLIRYLKNISNLELKVSFFREFLQKAERELDIINPSHKNLRRLSQNWGLLSKSQKEYILKKIYTIYQKYAQRSELFYILRSFINDKRFDLDKVDENTDMTLSTVSKIVSIGKV
jgi:hypothetical protein